MSACNRRGFGVLAAATTYNMCSDKSVGRGILLGIKVATGLVTLPASPEEQYTQVNRVKVGTAV